MALIQELPSATVDHYRASLVLKARLVHELRAAWRKVEPNRVKASWADLYAGIRPRVLDYQYAAAQEGASYSARSLAQIGDYESPSMFVDPMGFVGSDGEGLGLDSYLAVPASQTVKNLSEGMAPAVALDKGGKKLDQLASVMLADIGRQAAAVDVAARAGVGYVRMVNPPTCKDCLVLAGRTYRWNKGFLRHPGCDCVHVPAKDSSTHEGMVVDPYEHFHSLSSEQQNALFGEANAEAIREGADIFQVYNSSRTGKMSQNGHFTREGRSRHGTAGQLLKPGQKRLTPEGIYWQADQFGLSREETLDLLRTHGYLLPGGQNPHGVIRGQVWSAKTTQTAAEKRFSDAVRNWEEAQRGLNPYSSAAPVRRRIERGDNIRQWAVDTPLTQVEYARAEAEYYAVLTTKGESLTRSGQSLSRNLRANRQYYAEFYGIR